MEMTLKKLIEKPISDDAIERIKMIYKGITILQEKSRKAALEKNLEFMEKAKLMTPEEFHKLLFSKRIKKIPRKYKRELERYEDLLVNQISDVLGISGLKRSELGKMIGIPEAPSHLFELKKKGKRIGFVLIDKKDKTIDFIKDPKDLPLEFRKVLKKK